MTKQKSRHRQQPKAKQSTKVKRVTETQKPGLHSRNVHRNGYDFDKLTEASPALAPYVRPNPYGNLSIDFADPLAVKALNSALLKLHYQVDAWDIPQGFLCPPIPGRVDYLHYIADLLAGVDTVAKKEGSQHEGQDVSLVNIRQLKFNQLNVRALDIGTGANGVYPLLGIQAYGWHFVASDVDPLSLSNVNAIIEANACLQGKLQTRLQTDHQKVFHGIIQADDRFDITLCNPPFHSSLAEASEGTQRKVKNLAANRAAKGHKPQQTLLAVDTVAKNKAEKGVELNFGGQKAELWCEGGEKRFLSDMIRESKDFATQCLWFTSLVSKKENLQPAYAALQKAGAVTIKTIDMAQGNKLTRVLAWSFLTPAQRDLWAKCRS
jgi:23S rRNA (adenine1618-N6)-methyltransferase